MKGVRLSVVACLLLVSSLLFLSGCDLFPYSYPISPARDLTGTWRNKLSGKGIEFTIGPHCPGGPILKAWGDVELKLSQKGNDLSGTARIYNLHFKMLRSDWGSSEIWKQFLMDHLWGKKPLGGRVTGSRFSFLSHAFVWEGTFTTDIMSGDVHLGEWDMEVPCTEIEGEFRVMRVW